jgi:phosphoribosylamine--glycine ligase
MKVLLIGSGGREHALAWQLKKNPKVSLTSAPGSSALAALGEVKPIAADDIEGLTALAGDLKPDLVVIGPELPLVKGLADALRDKGHNVFGPSKKAAMIEGSKVFSKDFMVRHNIPTASYAVFYDTVDAKEYLMEASYPVVLKADGLAAGKGVVICGKLQTALEALKELSSIEAGSRILIEEYLGGEEVSYFVITDGRTIVPIPSAQDHKTIFDGDRGPNTGGMGAYSPAPIISEALEKMILDAVIIPAVEGLAAEGTPYCGLLYAGLMITLSGPKLLEFNARFGDPETQALMPRFKGDLAQILLDAAKGELKPTKLDWDKRPSVCVVMSAEGYPGSYRRGDEIAGLDKAGQMQDVVVFEAGVVRETRSVSEGSGEKMQETALTNGGRVVGVTALGNDLAEAQKRAYEAVSKISFNGAHFRRDIGLKALRPSSLYIQTPEQD